MQATLRVVKVFWALDDRLAAQRHFPAINWLMSYSQYQGTVDDFAGREVDIGWHDLRQDAMATLTRESELEELVRLVGIEALSPPDRLLMQVAKMIREDFLHQYAFDPQDTYTSMKKQFRMLKLIAIYETLARKALDAGAELGKITSIEALELVSRSKLIPEDQMHQFDDIEKQLNEQFAAITPLKETSDA
ncbi:MAG: hypothetical protein QGD94_06805 [Planctomycetia bacterium]|nr:hypothetical protein [Planctomycetia bacterium]